MTASPAQLKITYDQSMAFAIGSGLVIAGGMGDRVGTPGSEIHAPAEYPGHQGNANGRNVATNYTVSAQTAGASQPRLQASWKALGGTAVYAPDDALRRNVLLKSPTNTQSSLQLFVAHSPVQSTALSQPLASQADSSWTMSYKLVKRNGELSEVFTTAEIGAEVLTATAFASKLQAALNSLQAQRWQVSLSENQQSIVLKYSDTTGETVGWQVQAINFNGNGSLPVSWSSSPVSWPAQSPFPWFKSGERIQLKAANTIMDPAGNSLDPAASTVETVIP